MGQGLHTKIQQIAAESLGLDLEAVRVMSTRTDKIPNTSATAASAGADLNGAAVADACSELRGRLAEVAAGMLGCDSAAVRFLRWLGISQGAMTASDSVRESLRCGLSAASAAVRARLLPNARHSLRSEDRARRAVPLLRLRRGGLRSRSGWLHRRLSSAANRHPRRRRRFRFAAGRSRANRRRIHSGRRMVDAGRAGVGFARAPGDRRRVHLQTAFVVRGPGCFQRRLSGTSRRARRHFRQQSRGRTSADAGHLGARGDPRRDRRVRRGRTQSRSKARPRPSACFSRFSERARSGRRR